MSCPSVSTECAICLVSFKSTTKNLHTTECRHTFHSKCFDKIKMSSCPCCRTPVKKSLKSQIAENKSNYDEAHAKLVNINREIINEMNSYKTILKKYNADVERLEKEKARHLKKWGIDDHEIIICNYEMRIDIAKGKVSTTINKYIKRSELSNNAIIYLQFRNETMWNAMMDLEMDAIKKIDALYL
jgi:hypothetical protein